MKTTKRIISTMVLSGALFTSTAFGCGVMTNGTKCFVDSPNTGTTVTKTEKRSPFDFNKEIAGFFREIFGKIFG